MSLGLRLEVGEMSVQTIDVTPEARRKPAGGFEFVSVAELASAWWCYSEKLIRIADLRAWFACHELNARRCELEPGQEPRFNLDELRGLTGVPVSKLRGSITRLQAVGLLSWSESALTFGDGSGLGAEFKAFLSNLPNNARRVPVPRRIIRLIAGGARPALIACILGHLLRCLYYRNRMVEPRGRCKASWIADTFGVSLRRVKEARAELVQLGWLIPHEASQKALNLWGAWVSINLDWERLDGVTDSSGEPKSAPLPAVSEPKSAPPERNREPLRESKNQEPASGGPSGFSNPGEQGGEKPPEKPPTLRNVVPQDLRDTGRLLTLYDEAVRVGLVIDSDSERLKFVAAAEHARVVGTKSPCGLFVRFVRAKLWDYLTHDDEDAANQRLKRHFHGAPRREDVQVPQAPPSAPVLSEDARMVQAAHLAAKQIGYRNDPFYLLKREHPEWTRDRWDTATLELSGRSRPAQSSGMVPVGSQLSGLLGSLVR